MPGRIEAPCVLDEVQENSRVASSALQSRLKCRTSVVEAAGSITHFQSSQTHSICVLDRYRRRKRIARLVGRRTLNI